MCCLAIVAGSGMLAQDVCQKIVVGFVFCTRGVTGDCDAKD
jgi:hypothetical protein